MPKIEQWYVTEKGTDVGGHVLDLATRGSDHASLEKGFISAVVRYANVPNPNRRVNLVIFRGPSLEESWAEFSETYIWPDGRLGDDTRKVRIEIKRVEVNI